MRKEQIVKIIEYSDSIFVCWLSKTIMSPKQIQEVVYSSKRLYVAYGAITEAKYFILDSSNCLMKKRLYD